jgi:hypothetical protein
VKKNQGVSSPHQWFPISPDIGFRCRGERKHATMAAMHRQRKPAEEMLSDFPEAKSFVILGLFDTKEGLKAAESTCAFVERKLEDELPVERFFFNTRLLSSYMIWEQAVEAAVEADMIILALERTQHLSPELEKWAASWLEKREGDGGAIVALLPQGTQRDVPPEIFPHLQALAEKAKMDFICRTQGRNREDYYQIG